MKPGLSEIFAALNGVMFAGVALVREGHSTRHLIADQAVQAVDKSYRMKTLLLKKRPDEDEVEAKTRDLMQFLEAATYVLATSPSLILTDSVAGKQGGTVADLCRHIREMAEREREHEGRPRDKIGESGDPKKPFHAAYLPTTQGRRTRHDGDKPSARAAQFTFV